MQCYKLVARYCNNIYFHTYTHKFVHARHSTSSWMRTGQKAKKKDIGTRSSTNVESRNGICRGTIFPPCKVSPRRICIWWLVSKPRAQITNDCMHGQILFTICPGCTLWWSGSSRGMCLSEDDAQNVFGHKGLGPGSSHLAMPARHANGCNFANKTFISITPWHSWVRVFGLHGKMPNVMVLWHYFPKIFCRHMFKALFCKKRIMPRKLFNALEELVGNVLW